MKDKIRKYNNLLHYILFQNFCGTNSNTSWMPLLDLFVKVSHENESCQHLCERKGESQCFLWPKLDP